MNVRRIVWFGVSTLAIASWLASASTSGVRPPVVPLAPVKPSAADLSMTSLQAEMGRLHERLAPTAVPTRSRDLFRFQTRPRPRSTPSSQDGRVAPDTTAAVAIPQTPPLALIGVAEDTTADGVVRTAIVSGFNDVFLVKSGETIRDRYRIGPVSADAVQVIDLTTDVSISFALR